MGGVILVSNEYALLKSYIQDYMNYRKYSLMYKRPFTQDKFNARMMLVGHSLEKGMSFEKKKVGWGKEKAIRLCNLIDEYMKNYPVSDEMVNSLNILNAYRQDEDSCKSDDVVLRIDALLRLYHDKIRESEAGVKTVSKPKPFNAEYILDFYQSRSSVRYFSEVPLLSEDIKNAMALASTTPTACNRQTSRVYTLCDKERINQVLELQLGGQGWADKAPTMFIITGCLSCFGGIYERQQVYIDGGLYAMNFVMGLHLYGIATCFKMFIRDYKLQHKVCELCGIPRNEVPIVIIMAGYYRNDSVKKPVSHRFNQSDIKVS